ncbi:MAG: hypothetical protein IJB74_06900 [Clostridia bacterium]|nr:hypothetical protein [Clostridia bacterium]
MKKPIEDLYNDLKRNEKCFTSTESEILSAEIKIKLCELAEKLLIEEKNELYSLYKLSKEFTDICCENHFETGFQIGFKIAYDISEKLNEMFD